MHQFLQRPPLSPCLISKDTHFLYAHILSTLIGLLLQHSCAQTLLETIFVAIFYLLTTYNNFCLGGVTLNLHSPIFCHVSYPQRKSFC